MLGNWAAYMGPTTTNGSTGEAQVGSTTLNKTMANWSIPDQFRSKAIENVRLLVFAATEGTYAAQAFIFDTQSGASLTTLLVVTRRLSSPSNPQSPVAISYVTINSNAAVKQQYTFYNERKCRRCHRCLWLLECCCWEESRQSARGNTPEELMIIKNKIKADQFIWFNRQALNKTIKKRSIFQDNSNPRSFTGADAIEKFLSDNLVKAEVLASYNDSVLSALQTYIVSLKLSSQSMKLTEVPSEHILTVLSTLAQDYGFEDDYINSQFLEQLQKGRISYENLFTVTLDESTKHMKYIWILGQLVNNSTYSLNFLFMDTVSKELINKLLYNDTLFNQTNNINDDEKQLQIIRTSFLSDAGQFTEEQLLTMSAPWKLQTTRIALNILRFIAASTLIPQKHRMLSTFDSNIIPLNDKKTNVHQARFLPLKIFLLSKAISAAAGAVSDVINALKTTFHTSVTKLVRFGFTRFAQKSTVLKVMDIPADRATEFINALAIDYNLPTKGSFTLGLTYSKDFAWDRIDYLYSPEENGKYNSLTLFKNGDSTSNTASFFLVDISADWVLAKDLLLIQTSKSYVGGIFQETTQSIQEVPHALTMDEAVLIQKFFMIMALGNLAPTLGLNITYPQFN